MSMNALLSSLTAQAEARAAEAVSAAGAEAEAAEAAAAGERARRRATQLAQREAELRAEHQSTLAAAHRAAAAEELLARGEVVGRVLDRAEASLLQAAGSEAYQPVLTRDLRTALALLGSKGTKVRCPASLKASVSAAIGGAGAPVIIVDPAAGAGAMLVSGDGTVTVHASLDARFRARRAALAIEAVRLLVGPR